MWTSVYMEPMLGYLPCDTEFLTEVREPDEGPCQVAVSYTHLDVYKRQRHGFFAQNMLSCR